MPKSRVIQLAFGFVTAAVCLSAPVDVVKTIQSLGEKCRAAREYAFEGELLVQAQKAEAPPRLLSRARVAAAAGDGGKSYLRIEPEGKDAYVLISDGQKSWAFVPKLKQYTEEEAVATTTEDDEESSSDSERDLAEKFARLIVPTLAQIDKTAAAADIVGEAEAKFEKKKVRWPLLRVVSHTDESKARTFIQLAVDPDTLSVARMIWSIIQGDGPGRTILQVNAEFTSFRTGLVPPDTFRFDPPKNARLVESVPIPGQTGSFLLNQDAPDFELKTLDGEKIRLSDLRGKPVLLSFWASWCPPCRRELPALAALHDEYRRNGLVMLGVNDEGKGIARQYAGQALLPFPTLDDSGLKAHKLYRVQSIPTIFLIDKDGKIVRFLRGGKSPDALRAALASVGL